MLIASSHNYREEAIAIATLFATKGAAGVADFASRRAHWRNAFRFCGGNLSDSVASAYGLPRQASWLRVLAVIETALVEHEAALKAHEPITYSGDIPIPAHLAARACAEGRRVVDEAGKVLLDPARKARIASRRRTAK